jgi:hypothetical protein
MTYTVIIPDNDYMSIETFKQIAQRLDSWYGKIYQQGNKLSSTNKKELNKLLCTVKKECEEYLKELNWDREEFRKWWKQNIILTSV